MRRYQYPDYGSGEGDWLAGLVELFVEGGCAVLCLTLVVLLGLAVAAGARTLAQRSSTPVTHHQRR
jgi:hypothetical protein